MIFTWWQCTNETCLFRFPAGERDLAEKLCPTCQSPIVHRAEMEDGLPVPPAINQTRPQREIVAILDNIRSANNVGAMFRSSDAVGVSHVYVCGITATPGHKKVAKTALGAEEVIGWSQHNDVLTAVAHARAQGYVIWAVEGGTQAVNLFDAPLPDKVAIVMGSEYAGVDPAVLEAADAVVALPMRGIKQSLNVAVAFGIVCYHLSEEERRKG